MRKLGPETARSDLARQYSGFYERFMHGVGVDIGYIGDCIDNMPVRENAHGLDVRTPGYDGFTIPYPDLSLDFVFSSHCLEHVVDPISTLREWFRPLKVGGFLIVMVPHQFLYEKKLTLPSRYNADHKTFFTPQSLLMCVEQALQPNSYRIAHMKDNDLDYDYSILPDKHCVGACEIELVLRRIEKPNWELTGPK